jgi:hypothetical protein
MSQIIYTVVRHEGGWAYQASGILSERFRSREAAHRAARAAAQGKCRSARPVVDVRPEPAKPSVTR